MDPELQYNIRRTFAGLMGQLERSSDALPPLARERIARDVWPAFAECDLQQLGIYIRG
jgi:hypothetical protein